MAIAKGPKNWGAIRPLPPPCEPVRWLNQVTGTELYDWQAQVVRNLWTQNRPRVAYVQVPRKNGKTRLAASLALLEACLKPQRHIYAISDSKLNVKSVLMREIRDMVSASEDLRDSVLVYQHHFEVPETGSFIEARAGNFQASQGINPHLTLFDEVHLQTSADVWSGMQMAGAARSDALLLGITTPGYDLTSLAHALYTQVKAGAEGLYGRIFEADPAADIDDRGTWAVANPCFGRPGFEEAMAGDRGLLPEHEFRRFRLGTWTATDKAWLPYGAWADRAVPSREPPGPGERVWLGFDGSWSNDSTALVGVSEDLHVFVAGCWENPGRAGWRVPRADVHEAIHEAFATWDVVQLLCDPPFWPSEIAEWVAAYGDRVADFPTGSQARMAPACSAFHAAVMDGTLTHDGDPRLARHVSNAIVKDSPKGSYISKPSKDSPAKIDLAVAAVIAFHAAATCKSPRRAPVVVL